MAFRALFLKWKLDSLIAALGFSPNMILYNVSRASFASNINQDQRQKLNSQPVNNKSVTALDAILSANGFITSDTLKSIIGKPSLSASDISEINSLL